MTFILSCLVREDRYKAKGSLCSLFFFPSASACIVCVFVFAKCKMQNAALDDSQNAKKAPPKWGDAFSDNQSL